MRTLAAVLLILATPLSAVAGNHWRENRGASAPAYERGERPMYAPPGGGRPAYGPPGGGRPGYGQPGGGRPEYAPSPHGFRGPPPPVTAGPPPGAMYGAPPAYRSQQQRAREEMYGAPPTYRSQQQRAREEMRSGRRVPLPMVIERVRPRGAEYVDTREARDPSGRPLYVLRFRRHGAIFDVPVDAETGMVQR